jgi:DNA-binding MarR family transcriptional regulator
MSIEDDAKELAGYFHVLGKRMKRMNRSNPALCELISEQEAHVLQSVGGAGRQLTMSEIATEIGLSLSSATSLVDKLEQRKWVRRDRSEADRRVIRVGLTAQGKKFYDLIETMVLELTTDVLSTLDETEQKQLLSLFRKIAAQLSRA